MMLRHPEWLALLPVIAVAGWFLPRLGLWRPLRLVLLFLVTLTLAQPQWRRLADGVDLWVLLDSTVSAAQPMAKGLPEWEELLEKGRGSQDRLFYLNYAAEVMKRGAEGAEMYERNQRQTRTAQAITQALAYAQREGEGRPARILAITDGYSTESLTGLAAKLALQGVELDYRLARNSETTDYRVSALKLPSRAQLGEPFLIEIELRGNGDGKVPLTLLRNGRELKTSEVSVQMGSGSIRFTDRLPTAGVAHYEAIIQPATDAHRGNNRHEAMIEISGGPRVLFLTAYTDDPVAESLRRQGFTVETVTDLRTLRPGQLAGAKCVIFNNVPAFELPAEFLPSVGFYVREQGGSILMAGGKQSFAAGGYFESPLDPLLPVSMEMKQEHRKLMVALAIVMDRSGSMSMTVQNGFTKMSLADEGAANAIRFLGPQDLLTVLAVDSEAHEMVPLQTVGPNRDKMEKAVRRIESTGGGIFVYNGLRAAWDRLKNAPVGQRHIILFSDAADSEQPDKYKELIAEITANGGTISVIALGTRSDPDAWLLDDIAKLGKGRIFYTDKAEELPTIFSQETIAVARSAFLAEPVGTQAAGGWFEISSQPLAWPAKVDGYNLSYLRDWASQALITSDEYAAPLIAFGPRGTGRTAAISFPLGGEHSQSVRAWSKYGDLLQTQVRWLMGDSLPPGIAVRHHTEGTTLTIDLLYEEEWATRLQARAPRILLAHGPRAEAQRELAWERVAPGHYQARTELPEGELVRGAVQVGGQAISFGPTLVGTSTEWAFDEARAQELSRVSLASGGRELLEMSQAWRSPAIPRFTDLSTPLLIITLCLMLLDALITRTGWRLPRHSTAPRIKRAPAISPEARQHQQRLDAQPAPPSAASNESTPTAKPTPPPIDRGSRYQRAKKG